MKTSNKIVATEIQQNIDRLTPSERALVRWGRREEKRAGRGGILLEGSKLIDEALAHKIKTETGWFTGDYAENNPELIKALRLSGCSMRPVSQRVMRQISDLETPPGLAVVGIQPTVKLRPATASFKLIVALMLVQDPGNLGGVIRSADYFGADEVWVGPGSADPFNPKALRGSMGACLRLPVSRIDDIETRIDQFKSDGATVWAAVAHGSAESRIKSSEKMILMIGGESRGISIRELSLADKFVRIRGNGRSESLNLTVAASLLIYQALQE